MRWTTEPPREPGWYWYRPRSNKKWRLVETAFGHCGLREQRPAWRPFFWFMPTNGEWSGPIPEPEEEER
jgi:hypothetical protein